MPKGKERCLVSELEERREPEPAADHVGLRVRVGAVGGERREHRLRELPEAQRERTRLVELLVRLEPRHVPSRIVHEF